MHSKNCLEILLFSLAVALGVALICYPFIANRINQQRSLSLVGTYEAEVVDTQDDILDEARQEAVLYNQTLASGYVELADPFGEDVKLYTESGYYDLLNVSGTGLMGYIRIPCIEVELPIYHGVDSATLEMGVGHLPGSSLPVGGESTHAVLTGHTGLNTARLFTDLTKLEEGDIFILTVLGEKLAYEVDQILVVEPGDTPAMQIVSGRDYCTLVTCTPYGINTHRLLVRGVRTEYLEEYENTETVTVKESESQWMRGYINVMKISVAALAVVILLIILILFFAHVVRPHGQIGITMTTAGHPGGKYKSG